MVNKGGVKMLITIPYAITITKQAGIKQNYQSIRSAYEKRDTKRYILNACLYLLMNRDFGMSSVTVSD